MLHAVRMLTIAALLGAVALVAQAAGAPPCSFVGGYPAAQTPELLAKAQAMTDAADDNGLSSLRATGVVVIPQGTAEDVQCGPDKLCQVTIAGKRLWMLENGLQCQ
ncbi:hypothetical protein [Desulfovibrio sp. TomC]|uniref:hypothetical protein n=1 Tax=Desulfovibrio sp. TomC TaxID=1562888 RepID=UPI000575A8AD|nr:hypothetical protein [Desulfovibrio sp. TomC]KHK01385.1 hypothetical protein NY78_3139 [Desulfovibrio sp. TomC]